MKAEQQDDHPTAGAVPVDCTGLIDAAVAAKEYEDMKLRSMEPKRCPWCRSVVIYAEGRPQGDMHRVAMVCQKCLARGPEVFGEMIEVHAMARRAWNRMFESELEYELSKLFA